MMINRIHPSDGNHGRSNVRRGFTLIELLVVIAIISLLLSILIPSLQKARDLARTTVCLANVRSIGVTALQFYANDYNGRIPPDYMPAFQGNPFDDMATPWPLVLGPYLEMASSTNSKFGDFTKLPGSGWECPEAVPLLEAISLPAQDKASCRLRALGGYGINILLDIALYSTPEDISAAVWNSPWNHTQLPSPTLDQLPGDVVYLGDANIMIPPQYPAEWHSPVSALYGLDEIQDYYHHPDYRHNGDNAANFSYIDGHVQTVNFEDRFDAIKLYPK